MSPVTLDTPILGIARKWWIAATMTPSLLLMGLNADILDIPNQVIVPGLDSDRYRIQWATGAAIMGSVVGLAMVRYWRDRIGLKHTFMAAIFIAACGSTINSFSQDVTVFAPGRFIEGIGKGLSVATVLALLWREFPLRKDLATASYGVAIYFGKAIAPFPGAWLSDHPSWQAIFVANAVIGVITVLLCWWVLIDDKPAELNTNPFDFPGLILLMVWVLALVICLFRAQYWGWTTSRDWVLALAVFVVGFVIWVTYECLAPAPLIDSRLLKARTFHFTMIAKSMYMINLGALLSLLSSYMTVTRDYPRPTAGLVLLPGGAVMGATLIITGIVGREWNRKTMAFVGLVMMAGATSWLSDLDLYTDKWYVALKFCLWGLGAGTAIPSLISMPLYGLSQPMVVSSASIKNMVRVIPSAVGSLVVGIVLERHSDAHFDYMRQAIRPNRAVVENVTAGLTDHLMTHGSGGGTLTAEQAGQVIGGYIKMDAAGFATQTAMKWLALVALFGAMIVLFIRSSETRPPSTS